MLFKKGFDYKHSITSVFSLLVIKQLLSSSNRSFPGLAVAKELPKMWKIIQLHLKETYNKDN